MSLYDTIAGTADHLAGSTDEAFGRWHDQTTQIANSEWSDAQRLTGYARITTRHALGPIGEEVESFAFENAAGEFMGVEDTTDLPGPELGGSSQIGEEGISLEYRNPDAADTDPTHPDNRPAWMNWLLVNPEKIAAFLLVLVTLYLLKPLLEIGANLSE